ncbi:serine/arginine-rich splicing factor 4-like [Convolutriloba macropyga]|uniref:serine/arginine-rich splicing factor 4-like n=1 Tax=Convolutriloba macropyga TaxID=536237 RepID=UPI003F51EE99
MPAQIYLGDIPSDCRERDVEDFFKRYGRIDKISMKGTFAFVDFVDYRDVDGAVRDLHGRKLLGVRVRVERARGTPHGSDRYEYDDRRDDYRRERRRTPVWLDKYGPPTRTKYRVRVENLSSRCSWQDLKDYCRKGGNVTFAECHKGDDRTGIVEFETRDDMIKAIKKLDGTDINGRKITMKEDNPERSRSRSRSRSRRSRTRSRSKSRGSRSKSRSRSRSGDRKSREGSTRRTRSRSRGSRSKSRSSSRSRSKSK